MAIAHELDAAVAEHRPHSYATGVVGTLDPADRALRWVSAGHPPPRVLRHERLLHRRLPAPSRSGCGPRWTTTLR